MEMDKERRGGGGGGGRSIVLSYSSLRNESIKVVISDRVGPAR